MDTIDKLSKYALDKGFCDIKFIGVPKTIDNDLVGTDHTPGYGSAAKYIATSTAEIVRDCAVYKMKAVTIIEIMGRDAGWLAASAALAGAVTGLGVDYIYLPERVFSADQLYADVERAFAVHPNVVIAVSEGIRFSNGEYVGMSGQSGEVDVFGHKYLSGTSKTLENMIRAHFACKVRSVEVNILQRCAAHVLSKTDIDESFQTGVSAVRIAEKGESGVMVCVHRKDNYEIIFDSAPVHAIANQIKLVPQEFINEAGNGVRAECVEYMLPLIQGECTILWEQGLPKHFIL